MTSFLERAVDWYGEHGVRIERVMTDQGSGYRSRRFNDACRRLGIRHLYTRPYTPKTNGKAERFIQTLTRKWAHARPYRTSKHRARALPGWLNHYNRHRPHHGIGGTTPWQKLRLSLNNVLGRNT